jgi:hypothetical protein
MVTFRSVLFNPGDPIMKRILLVSLAILLGLVLVGGLHAQQPAFKVLTARGVVKKVEKDLLTLQPRGPDGKFEPQVVLRVTDTSKFSDPYVKKGPGDRPVIAQRTVLKAADLRPDQDQKVVVIYAQVGADNVLLTLVIDPSPDK